MIMPFLVKALLDNRKGYEQRAAEIGEESLFAQEPRARGYLRPRSGYRLYEQRAELCGKLNESVRENRDWLMETLSYPLARA